MNLTEQILTVLICVAVTFFCRALPFVLFSSEKGTPDFVRYLGRALPSAVFALIVVYCLRNVDIAGPGHGMAEAIGVVATVVTHVWRRQMMLSMLVGTLCYMGALYVL